MSIAEMQGWQEEDDHEEILEFCANQQRISFKTHFENELITISTDICDSDKERLVSVIPKYFMEHLFRFINENPTSNYRTYKTKSDYYLLMNLRNQMVTERNWMIDEIYKVWQS